MDYPGKVITKNQVTPTQTSATGVWTLDDAAAATRNNNWPVAGVPNPISKSLRFNSADSAYLNRTPASAGNRQIFTWSGWVKRSAIAQHVLFSAPDGSGYFRWEIDNGANQAEVIAYNGTSITCRYTTANLFRDPSAWYHFVFAIDTTQATSTNRVKIYVNGVSASVTQTTAITQNTNTPINSTVEHAIGRSANFGPYYFSGYMTEINFIDGQALTPSSFGMTDPITGVWEPLKYSGTYGTNGFYLNFKDATSTTTLGLDYSGNSNTWTTNNFSVTAGAGNDSLTDVPTPWIPYNTTGDVGGVVRGNYATLNPLDGSQYGANVLTLSNGNLQATGINASANRTSTINLPSGKWYMEFTAGTISAPVTNLTWFGAQDVNGFTGNGTGYNNSGQIVFNGSSTTGYATFTTNDIIGCAFDITGNTATYYKNGTQIATGTLGVSTKTYTVWVQMNSNGDTFTANFGQRPFAYTPPSGFRSLCTTNLPASTVLKGSQYMNAVTYTGTGTSLNSVTGVGFQPDFVWVKNRTQALNHELQDVLRPTYAYLSTVTTSAENTTSGYNWFRSFDSDGFTVSTSSTSTAQTDEWNGNTNALVGWCWKANGAGVTNTAGTITSTVSANTTSGFSIITYTGTGSAGATVGHGLGAVPSMIIFKRRNGTTDWQVYHTSLGNAASVYLNLTNASASSPGMLNSTTPTSTLITLGTSTDTNPSTGTMVAYCFAPISGFSAFGSYTGNGSTDGPFVYTGFRPRYLLVKRSDSTGDWIILDTSRDTYNLCTKLLYPNLSNAEETYNVTDILSNGFKQRNVFGALNASGGTYTYMAFAENPFKNALAR